MLFSVLSVFSSVLWTVVDGWMDGRELHFLTSTRVAVNAIIISTSRRVLMSGRESQTGIMAKFNRNFYLAGCFVVANFVFNRIASHQDTIERLRRRRSIEP